MGARFALTRRALLLTLMVTTTAAAAPRLLRLPRVYLIRGYLDRAPEIEKVIDRVDIAAPGRPARWLLVTEYRSASSLLLDRYLSHELQHPWFVAGKKSDVSRLLDAAPGARVEGTFVVYRTGHPLLRIADLDQPSP